MLVISIGLSIGWYLTEWVLKAQHDAAATAAQAPLNQLLIALHNYHEQHGSLPPAYIADETGKPMHSWRVLILPYIEEGQLHSRYRFDEPWNSPHNLSLADEMPRIFRSPTEPPSKRNANIVVVAGPDTPFPGSQSTKFDDFKDGMENTILLTEMSNSDICWLEPRDLDATTMSFQVNDRKRPSISSVSWREPYIVFADSIHTYPVPQHTPPEVLKALTTIAGGEAVTREQIEAP